MNKVKIRLELNLDSQLGKDVFEGLAAALSGVGVTEQAKVVKIDATNSSTDVVAALAVEEKPKRAKNTALSVVAAVEERPEVQALVDNEKSKTETAETKLDITLGEIKADIAKNVSKHREAIKAKLTEYNVPNSDQLGKENYGEFHKFLKELK